MSDEENTPSLAEEQTVEDNKQDEAKPPLKETVDYIVKANQAADRLEAANRKAEDLLNKENSERIQKILGGKSSTETKKEESDEEYAKKVMQGGN